jgi:hypothetical protein
MMEGGIDLEQEVNGKTKDYRPHLPFAGGRGAVVMDSVHD